jgi:hypothetical protein
MSIPCDTTAAYAPGLSGVAAAAALATAISGCIANFCSPDGPCLCPSEWYTVHDHAFTVEVDTASGGGDGTTRDLYVVQATRYGYSPTLPSFDPVAWQSATLHLDNYANWPAFCNAWKTAQALPDGYGYVAHGGSPASAWIGTATGVVTLGTRHTAAFLFAQAATPPAAL